jgi:YaiO family outer membrane protein
MTGIYRGGHWYNRAAMVIICRVQSRPLALIGLLSAMGSTASAQGEPEQRAGAPATTAGIGYTYAYFRGAIDPWQLTAFSVGTRSAKGTYVGRINVAERFATVGAQYEVDAYPSFGKMGYAYLNAGYSHATIFPQWRFGAEVFRTLPHANEASLGLRSLTFPGERVTLFTGSLGRYTGNYWFSVRPFVREKPTGGFASAVSITGRRYYADSDTYVGARIGAGNAPTDALDPSQLARERSRTFGLQAARANSPRATTTWSLNYERDENPSQTLDRWEFGMGLKLRY